MNAAMSKQSTAAPKRDGGKFIGWGWAVVAFSALAFVGGFDDSDYTLIENFAYSAVFAGIGIALLVHGKKKRNQCVTCRRVGQVPGSGVSLRDPGGFRR